MTHAYADTLRFVHALFEPDDCIELRLCETWEDANGLKKSKLHHREWVRQKEFAECCPTIAKFNQAPTWANSFFGVCPRRPGKGDKAAIPVVRALWSDLDGCLPDEAVERVRKAGLQEPTILIGSGHGTHLYWKLDGSFVLNTPGDRMRVEAVNRELAMMIGGDHTHDVTRILRLPGFMNTKNARNKSPLVACILVALNAGCSFAHLEEAVLSFSEDARGRIENPPPKQTASKSRPTGPPMVRTGAGTLTDDQIVDKLGRSKDGARMAALFNGLKIDFKSSSEADWKLVCRIAFYTRDPGQIDAIFRRSALFRPKWDEVHGAERETYGQMTVRRALDKVATTYTPRTPTSPPPTEDDRDHSTPPAGGDPLFPPPPKTGPAPVNRDPDSYPHTDLGNAERFLDTYGKIVRYTETHGICVFDGQRWVAQGKAVAHGLAIKAIRAMAVEIQKLKRPPEAATYASDEDRAKALKKHMRGSESSARTEAVLFQGRGVAVNTGLFIGKDDVDGVFDVHPFLLNVRNGMVDLETGRLLPHRREAYQTYLAPVDYQPKAQCPAFLNFLAASLPPDMVTGGYVQRALGYMMTGSVREHAFFFLYGRPGSGKSTFSETVSAMLGEYSRAIQSETLMVQYGSQIPNDIAALRGARLVTTNEVEEGKKLAEAKVSEYTGGDLIAARFMRAEWFKFMPRFKLVMRGNFKPRVRNPNSGVWRRLHVWEFPNVVPEARQDKELREKLLLELPGILAWAVEGARWWLRDGLRAPESVSQATRQYREESDTVGRWREECTLAGEQYADSGALLYQSYSRFCVLGGERPLANNEFSAQLESLGHAKDRSLGQSMWTGLQLTEDSRKAINAHSPHYKLPW